MTDDQEIVLKLTEEIAGMDRRMELLLKPDSVFHLVGVLQLAKRHPNLGGPSRELADRFIAGAREYFAECPTILDVIRRGDDPNEDRRR